MNTQNYNELFKQFSNNLTITGPDANGNFAKGDSYAGAALYLGSNDYNDQPTLQPELLNLSYQNTVAELTDFILWVNGPSYSPGGGAAQIDLSLASLYDAAWNIEQDFDTAQNIYIHFQPVDIVVNGQFAKSIVFMSDPIYLNS